MNFTDTIAAIATPMGEGGVGIIRLSGDSAYQIALGVLRTSKGKQFSKLEDRKVYYGKVIQPELASVVDEVLFFYAQKPRSYTREDVVEIQAHGGSFVLGKILKTVLSMGARMAEPGEFTMRAFLNGRIDLVQAESIIDLIRAKTDRSQELALAQLTGRTSKALFQLEEDLYTMLVAVEAVLDYPEEGLPEVEISSLLRQAQTIEKELVKLSNQSDEGRKIREGVNLVIVGRPNVGKSSLLNAFIEEERAIVTEIPGTTRDIIETQFQLNGIPFILTDTAGLRETDNLIERLGIEKTEQSIEKADLILFVLDGSRSLSDEDQYIFSKIKDQKYLIVLNKIDLPTKIDLSPFKLLSDPALVHVSSLKREGFEQLEGQITEMIGLGNIQLDDRPMLSRIRHKNALEKAIDSLRQFQNAIQSGVSEDLLAVDLRTCLGAVGEVTGKDVSAEVVHRVFETFCIGK